MKLFLKTIVLAAFMALFAACGGSNIEWFPEANKAPVANAGAYQSVVVGDTVTLDGSASSDENRDKLTYGWSIISKPEGSVAPLSNTTVVNPTFTPDLAGQYEFSLTVNDGEASSAASTVIITASTGNAPPVADAGANQNVVTGAVVTLDGSASSDANADTLTYAWTITSLPSGSTAALSSTTAAKPTFTADKDGDYVFSLMVNDGAADSAADSVTVTATTGNAPPVANAGADQNVVTLAAVTLDGSASSDANGNTLTYAWTITSRPSGSTATLSSTSVAKPTFTADKAGNYVFSLIVNDGTVNSAADSVTITAATGNSAPVANAGVDQNVATGAVVTLDGSGTDANTADTLTYVWTVTSVPSGSTAALSSATVVKPTFTADKAGNYIFSLIVNDGTVNSAADSVTVTATAAANIAPVANAGLDQTVVVGTTVQLDGSGSSDANGDALTYIWSRQSASCGALSSATAVNPTLTSPTVGTCVISLEVFDNSLGSTPDTVTITVISSTGSITVTW